MATVLRQLQSIWQRLETPQRATIILVGLGLMAIIAAVFYGASQPDYTVLASGLTPSQSYRIAAELDNQGVAWRMVDNETAILVPGRDRYRLRNDLAEKELLGDGSQGFEILDTTGFGTSTFLERKRFDRAIGGELERSFTELPGVRSARVLIVQPPPSPFLDDERRASASIKLQMEQGRRLSQRQVAGIVRLCAGAVEGLTPDRVQVMDDSGLLTRDSEDPLAHAASNALEARRAMETHLTQRAQEMLDRVLGPGRSMVSIATDLDFTQRSAAESAPTNSVLLRQVGRTSDESTPVPDHGGVAGTAPNVEAPGGGGGTPRNATRMSEDDTREFVVGKRTTTRQDEVGILRGMTVSIWLDHKTVTETVEEEDGTTSSVTRREPYGEEERSAFADMVLNAIGYHAARGAQRQRHPDLDIDSLFSWSVSNLPMHETPQPEEPAQAAIAQFADGPWPRYLLAAVVAMVLLMVARGQLRRSHDAWATQQARMEEEARATAQAGSHDPERQQEEQAKQRIALRDRVLERVQQDPKVVAQVLKNWIRDA